MYKSIIFDLDGTLVDSSKGIVNAAMETLKILEYPPMTEEEIKSCIGPPLGRTLIEKLGYAESEISGFNRVFRDLYKNKYLMEVTVYNGIIQLLEHLRGKYRLSVATNKRYDYTDTMLKNLELLHYFDTVEGSDFEGKLTKKDLIDGCVLKSNISREKTVMIGDTTNDAFAARACGIDFIAVLYGMGFKTQSDVPYGTAVESPYNLLELF